MVLFIIYLILAFILFILTEFSFKKFRFTEMQNIFFSLVYLLIVSGIFNNYSENIFIVYIFYWIIKMIYISNFLGKDYFCDKRDFKISLVLIISSFLINKYIINEVDSIFLSVDESKLIIWIFVFMYFYQFISTRSINGNNFNNVFDNVEDRIITDRYVVINYAKFKLKFDDEINNKEVLMRLVVYTIMIYENYKKPFIFRKVDNLLFRLNKNNKKLGIMQVQSKKFIDDFDSINLVCKKIDSIYHKQNDVNKKKDDIGLLVLKSYYKKMDKNIEFIYNTLKEFNNL